MSEMEMVEKGAAAILARVPAGYGMTETEAREYARAALEAMREPTEAMVVRGDEVALRDRLKQQIAQRDDEIARQRDIREAAERSVSAMYVMGIGIVIAAGYLIGWGLGWW